MRAQPLAVFALATAGLLAPAIASAQTSASTVGYIVAARESSIVVGAAAGVVWLGERFDRWKLAGVSSVTIGLVLLRLA